MQQQITILRVGRGDEGKDGKRNDIKVDHPSVSRSHLEVFIDEEGRVFITDLNSQNGTFVNGNRITGDYLLKEGDILKLGGSNPLPWKYWATGRNMQSAPSVDESGVPESNYKTTFGAPDKKRKTLLIVLIVALALLLLVVIAKFMGWFGGADIQGKIFTSKDISKKTLAQLDKAINQDTAYVTKGIKNGDTLRTSDGVTIILTLGEVEKYTIKEVEDDTTVITEEGPVFVLSNPDASIQNTIQISRIKGYVTVKDALPITTPNQSPDPTLGNKDPKNKPGTQTPAPTKPQSPVVQPKAEPDIKLDKNGKPEAARVQKGGEGIGAFISRIKGKYPEYKNCVGLTENQILINNPDKINKFVDKDGVTSKKLQSEAWIRFSCN